MSRERESREGVRVEKESSEGVRVEKDASRDGVRLDKERVEKECL